MRKQWKKCKICKILFLKPYSISQKEWKQRKFCSRRCKNKSQKKLPLKWKCDWCGKQIFLTWKDQRRKEKKFCGRSCSGRWTRKISFQRIGHSNHWKGGKLKDYYGYVIIWSPNHPNKDMKGYVKEHRLVMEKKLGRYLTKKEVVHHINRNPADNRIKNLQLFSDNGEHKKSEKKQYDEKI